MSRAEFDRLAAKTMADTGLLKTLETGLGRKKAGRLQAWAELPDAGALRAEAQQIRARVIEGLEDHLARFSAAVTSRGGHVYRAATAAAASAYIADLAAARGVRLAVKSKSMVSEEIGLNRALQQRGVRAVETDLGEYIIQLEGETPFHIIGPSLHKSRFEVQAIFERESGERLADDPAVLTAFARARLREEFLSAEMGISGCNFAVAETGSISLTTNEGNGRMVTSLPRLQVTVMGMERIVPTWDELGVMLSLLSRSATGQKLSVYTTLLTPPAPGKEHHVVIIDGGRSALIGSDLQEVLHCIRCGACLNVCPVYRQIGGHAYGPVYSGPIGAVLNPALFGDCAAGHLPHASTLCGACSDACPVKIDLPGLLLAHRRRHARATTGPAAAATKSAAAARAQIGWRQRLAFALWAAVFSRPALYRLTTRLAARLQRPWLRDGRLRRGPAPLSLWTGDRDLPPLARRRLRDHWSAGGGLSEEEQGS